MLDGSGGWAHGDAPWPRLAPGTVVAGFTIEGLLATGGFGTVYRARRDGRPFAIKLVPLAPRGNREVDALRRVHHPNVVGFHGYGFWPDEQPRFLVLALELVEGLPLDLWSQRMNPTSLDMVGRVLLPFSLTLSDVHGAGVVHRDIKEANILVRDSDGLPVLVDFGAAGLEGAPRLTQWMPPGTPEYRSPETLRHAREWEGEPYPVGPAEDLWALGVVTYILLTRTLPFGDRNDPGMVNAILERTPRAPHELNPRVPPALSDLCMRMLEKDPEHRYPDARALADALSEEWARADKSWRVPLFPEVRREERPAPPPAAPVAPPRKQAPRWRRLIGPVLAAVVVGGVCLLAARAWQPPTATPSVQLPESPLPAPPQKASPRQEMASPQVTGEVGTSAGLQKSPSPAPVARATSNEEPEMMKPQKLRSVAATALMGSAACVGAGCASAPLRQRPPPQDCPPGAIETHERFGLWDTATYPVFYVGQEMVNNVVVKDGSATVTPFNQWKELPDKTLLHGKLYVTKDRVYGHFTTATLPGGEVVPICMQLLRSAPPDQGLGMPVEPGSTPKKTLIPNILSIMAVNRFD